jgi:hypothetical protein
MTLLHYKVVELKGRRDPRSGAGDTPEVIAEDIETALNQQGRDNWELFTVLERFTETSHTEEGAYAGIGASSQQYSSRIAVPLIFKKVMAEPSLLPKRAISHFRGTGTSPPDQEG